MGGLGSEFLAVASPRCRTIGRCCLLLEAPVACIQTQGLGCRSQWLGLLLEGPEHGLQFHGHRQVTLHLQPPTHVSPQGP